MTIRIEDGSVLYGCVVEWEKEVHWGYVYRLLSKDGEYYAQVDDDGMQFRRLYEDKKDCAVRIMKRQLKLMERRNMVLTDLGGIENEQG